LFVNFTSPRFFTVYPLQPNELQPKGAKHTKRRKSRVDFNVLSSDSPGLRALIEINFTRRMNSGDRMMSSRSVFLVLGSPVRASSRPTKSRTSTVLFFNSARKLRPPPTPPECIHCLCAGSAGSVVDVCNPTRATACLGVYCYVRPTEIIPPSRSKSSFNS